MKSTTYRNIIPHYLPEPERTMYGHRVCASGCAMQINSRCKSGSSVVVRPFVTESIEEFKGFYHILPERKPLILSVVKRTRIERTAMARQVRVLDKVQL